MGDRCAVVGAGGCAGLLRRLLSAVGPSGEIIVVDRSTELLGTVDEVGMNVVLRMVDLAHSSLGSSQFDLVVARGALAAVRSRGRTLAHLVDGVRAGGWLVVEEADLRIWGHGCDGSDVRETATAVTSMLERLGIDPTVAGHLPDLLEGQGLLDVDASVEVGLLGRRRRADDQCLGMIAETAPLLISGGLATTAEIDALRRFMETPTSSVYSPMIVTAWGRKPHG